jgi:hypothetical protein
MENGHVYPLFTLRRFTHFSELEAALKRTPGGGQPDAADKRRIHIETLLEALKISGLVEACGKDWRAGSLVRDAGAEIADGRHPAIAMDTSFSCILYPEIAFADALTLSSFCNVRPGRYDNALISFEMSRASVIRGFDLGMNAASILALLERLSLHRLDESTGWTLRDWEQRYTAVSLHQGLVLCVAPENRYLVESSGEGKAGEKALAGEDPGRKPDAPLSPLISRVLAPGVYLLSASDKAEALDALERAGVDIVAQPCCHTHKSGTAEFRRSAYPSLKNDPPQKILLDARPGSKTHPSADVITGAASDPVYAPAGAASEQGEALKEKFRQALKKKHLSRAEQEELTSRIERGMIVSESQLEGVSVRYEKLEARGLDYVGKASIVKQAMAAKSFVEVSCPGPDGIIQKILGIPDGLEKSDGGTILLLRVMRKEEGGETELIRLSLGKISLIRRIKQSIFED